MPDAATSEQTLPPPLPDLDQAAQLVARLAALMRLRTTAPDTFEGDSEDIGNRNVYGGQLLGQALMAATSTVEAGREAHSLHAYFLRGARHAPIAYAVERLRDGYSFSHRRVVASQDGRAVFEMTASFQSPSAGVFHQAVAPVVDVPERLASELALRRAAADRLPEHWRTHKLHAHGIEYRQVDPLDPLTPAPRAAIDHLWMRAVAPLADDPALHRALLAYASDYGLLRTAMVPHGLSFVQEKVSAASLDHAMWFHAPLRIDDWLLHSIDAPIARGGRALARGSVYTRDGTLVASTIQEGLVRAPA